MTRETILIVGSGAREHAIAEAFRRSPHQPDLICFGAALNPGIEESCKAYQVGRISDGVAVSSFAAGHKATLAIIGPEAPLAAGVADVLWAGGIPVVGPKKDLARIESSKSFTRGLLARHKIPGNPFFQRFNAIDGVADLLAQYPGRHVIKDDGLAGGKGVKVCGDHLKSMKASLAFCNELLENKRPFVIEEKLEGEEFSLLSFCDGKTLRHMPAVQDHKRAYEGDKGPNTGGMGTYTDADHKLPFLTDADIAAAQAVNEKVAAALAKDCGYPYQGILYGGFMATADGVKLIEYNARFGDPEALNLLTLLESDFVSICRAITGGTLDKTPVAFAHKASVCKYIVPQGYPDNARVGEPVILPPQVPAAVKLYLGAVDMKDGRLTATGSRTVGIVGTGDSIAKAEKTCERIASRVPGRFFYRYDIGSAALVKKRVEHMKKLRPG
jgi:phosphoribosylamine---glycine ligase